MKLLLCLCTSSHLDLMVPMQNRWTWTCCIEQLTRNCKKASALRLITRLMDINLRRVRSCHRQRTTNVSCNRCDRNGANRPKFKEPIRHTVLLLIIIAKAITGFHDYLAEAVGSSGLNARPGKDYASSGNEQGRNIKINIRTWQWGRKEQNLEKWCSQQVYWPIKLWVKRIS